jgi:hypothetical protein
MFVVVPSDQNQNFELLPKLTTTSHYSVEQLLDGFTAILPVETEPLSCDYDFQYSKLLIATDVYIVCESNL